MRISSAKMSRCLRNSRLVASAKFSTEVFPGYTTDGSAAMFRRATEFSDRTAIVSDGKAYTYQDLLDASAERARSILHQVGKKDLDQAQVAFLVKPSFEYVATQWAIWRAGGCAVPLCYSHPAPELEYTIGNSEAVYCYSSEEKAPLLQSVASKLCVPFEALAPVGAVQAAAQDGLPAQLELGRRAQIIYTSGTTGRPKGVVATWAKLEARINSLTTSWEWSKEDKIVNPLPMHHEHGVMNILCCAMWSGAQCEFMDPQPRKLWDRLQEGDLTLFMAVPTIYHKMLKEYDTMAPPEQARLKEACLKLRLMVSGSAALPVSVMKRFEMVSGHRLLERYGMTEIGMGLSNPYHGDRIEGTVGFPLPGVQCKVDAEEGEEGELFIKGPAVFSEYWKLPEATAKEFDAEGWFKTGDVVACDPSGRYSIKGRASVDILKTGGYKVSALDIEQQLIEHPDVASVAVFGVEDEEWGQRVAAVVVMKPGVQDITLAGLRAWGKGTMAGYRIPSIMKVLPEMPVNVMGKVNKKDLAKRQLEGTL